MVVKLNVGGKIFITTLSTLTNESSMLSSLVQNANPALLIDGCFFIDRDYTVFHYILNFLRGSQVLPKKCSMEFQLLQEEANYYCLERLHRHLYHLAQPNFKKYDLIMVKGNKFNIVKANEDGYIVSKNNQHFQINCTEEITSAKIEANDNIIIYHNMSWIPAICSLVTKSDFIVKLHNGKELTMNKFDNVVRV